MSEREQGSGTVVVLVVVMLLLVLFAVVGSLAQVGVARHRAATAADLVALAAASDTAAVPGPCGGVSASSAARHNDAELRRCEVLADGSAQVEVAVRLIGPLARLPPPTAQARAGPAGLAARPMQP